MPSPFPGMDPYIESPGTWSDFHGTFLMSIRAELNRSLPPGYVARWDRYVWIDESSAEPQELLGRPDTFVSDTLGRSDGHEAREALAAPAIVQVPVIEPQGKPFLKIIDMQGRRVVTAVELLSPANKTLGPKRDAYLTKREDYFRTKTNLVELDFLRSGQRPPVDGRLPPADYYILICRACDYPQAGIWPLSVRDSLPSIPVPLNSAEPATWLALQPCLVRTYDEARFSEDIDYTQPPEPPLREPDAAWARELLAARKN
jgi:hypothetical protein